MSKTGFSVDSAFDKSELQKKSDLFLNDKERMPKGVSIRFHKKRYEALKKIFDSRGLDFGSGIRQIAYEWLEKQI